jgi:hypothetical protein
MSMNDGSVFSRVTTGTGTGTGTSRVSGSDHDDVAPRAAEHINPVVAKREQQAVARKKLCVMYILLLAVVAIATSTYLLISDEDQEDFQTQVKCQIC